MTPESIRELIARQRRAHSHIGACPEHGCAPQEAANALAALLPIVEELSGWWGNDTSLEELVNRAREALR